MISALCEARERGRGLARCVSDVYRPRNDSCDGLDLLDTISSLPIAVLVFGKEGSHVQVTRC